MNIRQAYKITHLGNADPWGVSNSKVGAPSTYRSFTTCPSYCPYHRETGDGSCYGLKAHTALAARRCAGGSRGIEAVRQASQCARLAGTILRLHTTGEPGEGREMITYFEGITEHVRDLPVASYTHLRGEDLTRYKEWAREVGVHLWLSDTWEPGGAVVVSRDTDMRALRAEHRDLRIVACPAQITDITCDECRLCYRPHNGRTIVFRRH